MTLAQLGAANNTAEWIFHKHRAVQAWTHVEIEGFVDLGQLHMRENTGSIALVAGAQPVLPAAALRTGSARLRLAGS